MGIGLGFCGEFVEGPFRGAAEVGRAQAECVQDGHKDSARSSVAVGLGTERGTGATDHGSREPGRAGPRRGEVFARAPLAQQASGLAAPHPERPDCAGTHGRTPAGADEKQAATSQNPGGLASRQFR